jgi:choline dehydrogenase-like flavoprotein
VLGEDGLGLQTAALGWVAHEVGTLRMAGDGTGVVDQDLKFLAYDNLYAACDNCVFPTSPAANPSLTLAALALRLARTLRRTARARPLARTGILPGRIHTAPHPRCLARQAGDRCA